jgi:hypothetical protein
LNVADHALDYRAFLEAKGQFDAAGPAARRGGSLKPDARERRALERRPLSERHQRYEAEKQDWLRRNPNATPAEYDAAMMRIARELGL